MMFLPHLVPRSCNVCVIGRPFGVVYSWIRGWCIHLFNRVVIEAMGEDLRCCAVNGAKVFALSNLNVILFGFGVERSSMPPPR